MPERTDPRNRSEQLWILAMAVTALVGSFVLQPAPNGGLHLPIRIYDAQPTIPGTCFFKLTTGLPCPGCGLTRSFVHVANGNVHRAAAFNWMGPVLYILCILQIPYRLIQYSGVWESNGAWRSMSAVGAVVVWALIGGLIIAWIFRLSRLLSL